MIWIWDDGGRALAGFSGQTGDCVTRAIAIATGLSYRFVYDGLNDIAYEERPTKGKRSSSRTGVYRKTYEKFLNDIAYEERPTKGKRSSSRTGVYRKTYEKFLFKLGWIWTPTMLVGQGCKVHLVKEELPPGRLIVSLSRHLAAVIDGTVHDISDPCREGTRCVYGYYQPPTPKDSFEAAKGD